MGSQLIQVELGGVISKSASGDDTYACHDLAW